MTSLPLQIVAIDWRRFQPAGEPSTPAEANPRWPRASKHLETIPFPDRPVLPIRRAVFGIGRIWQVLLPSLEAMPAPPLHESCSPHLQSFVHLGYAKILGRVPITQSGFTCPHIDPQIENAHDQQDEWDWKRLQCRHDLAAQSICRHVQSPDAAENNYPGKISNQHKTHRIH